MIEYRATYRDSFSFFSLTEDSTPHFFHRAFLFCIKKIHTSGNSTPHRLIALHVASFSGYCGWSSLVHVSGLGRRRIMEGRGAKGEFPIWDRRHGAHLDKGKFCTTSAPSIALSPLSLLTAAVLISLF